MKNNSFYKSILKYSRTNFSRKMRSGVFAMLLVVRCNIYIVLYVLQCVLRVCFSFLWNHFVTISLSCCVQEFATLLVQGSWLSYASNFQLSQNWLMILVSISCFLYECHECVSCGCTQRSGKLFVLRRLSRCYWS